MLAPDLRNCRHAYVISQKMCTHEIVLVHVSAVHLEPAAVQKRLRELRHAGMVMGHVSKPAWCKLGAPGAVDVQLPVRQPAQLRNAC